MFFVSEYEFLKHIPFTLDMNFIVIFGLTLCSYKESLYSHCNCEFYPCHILVMTTL